MSWNGEWHPLAERFPLLSEDEIREMAESIAERGQYVPCRMTPEGLGLDGRNRVAACAIAGVAPSWEPYEGEPVPFIIEVNAERRHLTTGQRAMAVAIGLVEEGLRENGRYKRGSVPSDQTGPSSSGWKQALVKAGLVLDHAPKLADEVLLGNMALEAAWKEAERVRSQKEELDGLPVDLIALVKNKVLTLEEALERVEIRKLPDDLEARVNEGGLSLGEAKAIVKDRAERLAEWAADISKWLGGLARMAGHPVPEELGELLSPEEYSALKKIVKVTAWKELKDES